MGRTVLVTGGSRGIGRAIVKKFHREGYTVIFTYRTSKEEAERLRDELGGRRVSFHYMDLLRLNTVSDLLKAIEEEYGKLDVLVNNAGVFSSKKFEELTIHDWERVIKVNLTGTFYVIRESLELLKKSPAPAIINVASIAGQTGNVAAGVDYAASKAGIIGLTKKLAVELAKYGIRVNAVAPSFVDTDLVREFLDTEEKRERVKRLHPLGIIIKPEDVAEAVFFLADYEMSRAITGTVISINAGRYT